MSELAEKCLSKVEFARMYRIGLDKVNALINSRALRAIDIGSIIGRKQIRIPPSSIAEFEERLAVKPAAPRRRKSADDGISPSVAKLLDEEC